MKLEKILDKLNSFEKNPFLKVIDSIISKTPKNTKEVEKILSGTNKELKDIDNLNIAKVFNLIEDEFAEFVKAEFVNTASQLDILIDIAIRDGNCIMKEDWFSGLYEKEINKINIKLKEFNSIIENNKSELDPQRKRDYNIYKACIKTAYTNDLENNQEPKITNDELSMLLTLAKKLELSQEEVKLINYLIIPINKIEIDTLINYLKNIGVILSSRKNRMVYVADEIVRILRKVRKKEVADKFFRRTLRLLREAQINLICKKYNISRKLPIKDKINLIINGGVSFKNVLTNDIFKEGTKVTEKKIFINDLCDKELKISPSLKGVTLEDKISNLIKYFENIEKDEKVGISIDGYEKLLMELSKNLQKLSNQVKSEFELQEEKVLKNSYLLDFNIKPRDILEIISEKELEEFCKFKGIKTRGDIIRNILDAYKDSENIYIENYANIGYRDLKALKENGIIIKESELGIKFEDLTKTIFEKLGFNVDEKLRKKLNTKKDKIDIVLNLENNNLIIIECKTIKESGYNKYSSVSRQLKAYLNLVKVNGFSVIKSLLIAPEFSDEFVNDCELEYELNLSLLTASSLVKILEGVKNSKENKNFSYKLLMRDVLINEDRILKAISK